MDAKTKQRNALRHSRSLLSAADLSKAAEGFLHTGLEFLAHLELPGARQGIAAYLPFGNEPDIRALLEQLHRQGRSIYLPICEAEYQLSWVLWHPSAALQRSAFSWVLEPAGERHGIEIMKSIELLLIPALAVDVSGRRIGQGGGYYDRFLANLAAMELAGMESSASVTEPASRAVRAAVVYSSEVLAAGELVAGALDQPVEYVLSEEFFRPLGC